MTILSWLRTRRMQVLLAGALLVGTAFWFLPSLFTDTIVDEGGGPPDSSVAPPFEEDEFAPLVHLTEPSGPACTWFTDEALSTLVGVSLTASNTQDGCRWTGTGIEVELSLIGEPITAAISEVAENWPEFPEVTSHPVNGLFLHDATRSALLIDAGPSTILVSTVGPNADRAGNLRRLLAIGELLAG